MFDFNTLSLIVSFAEMNEVKELVLAVRTGATPVEKLLDGKSSNLSQLV